MLLKIPRLYDSHTHFLATGEFSTGLNLHSLQSAEDLNSISLENPQFYRGDWLVGFGWNEKSWPQPPNKKILDKMFPDRPVFLARMDGHRSWVNTLALQFLGIQSEDGILKEKQHLEAWERLPVFSRSQQKEHVRAACRVFNKAGYTHVRDMTCTDELWNVLVEMSDKDELTLAIEENYTTHTLHDFESVLERALYAKKAETPVLRMKGLKLFYDGSLGSETALLSQPYGDDENRGCGSRLWALSEVEEALKRTWDAGLEFSVHVIGDQAAHEIVEMARQLSARGSVGRLNLEHAQVLRPETIRSLKPLHVRCHMQPCHWLSDRVWLKEKLGDLYKYAFPWEALRLAQVPMSFGCDSPVEVPSFIRNKQALEESPSAGIKALGGDWLEYWSHPDASYADSWTLVEGNEIKEVCFRGKKLE
jgi:predicted amidohydrolase YtcJ